VASLLTKQLLRSKHSPNKERAKLTPRLLYIETYPVPNSFCVFFETREETASNEMRKDDPKYAENEELGIDNSYQLAWEEKSGILGGEGSPETDSSANFNTSRSVQALERKELIVVLKTIDSFL
jgi:hypothetical protein